MVPPVGLVLYCTVLYCIDVARSLANGTQKRCTEINHDTLRACCVLCSSSEHHPQHNGKIERMHRSWKNSLRAGLLGRVNGLSELPWVMLGLRAASNLVTGVLPSILVTGQQPTLPGQLVVQRPTINEPTTFGRQLASAMAAQTFHENKNVQ